MNDKIKIFMPIITLILVQLGTSIYWVGTANTKLDFIIAEREREKVEVRSLVTEKIESVKERLARLERIINRRPTQQTN